MTDDNKEKIFDHEVASISDKIALIAELEHIRRHALRSAAVSTNGREITHYLITANQARDNRRALMKEFFPSIRDEDWCLCKSAACLRQLAYEIWDEDAEELRELDNLVDNIWGKALNKDLSGCAACKEDKGVV